jgi:hypothetical protein
MMNEQRADKRGSDKIFYYHFAFVHLNFFFINGRKMFSIVKQNLIVIVSWLYLLKGVQARPNTEGHLVKQDPSPSCEEIGLMKSEINQIYDDVNLHSAGLRLGILF